MEKDLFGELFSRFWDGDGHLFGNPRDFKNFLHESTELEEESFEVLKNGVKTTILCKFNKEGYMVSHQITSVKQSNELTISELSSQLKDAIEKEDYCTVGKIANQLQERKIHTENQ